MFDTRHHYGEQDCPHFEAAMSNLGSAAGVAPLPVIRQPSLNVTVALVSVGVATNLAAYNYWREMCRWNPFLAPFVR